MNEFSQFIKEIYPNYPNGMNNTLFFSTIELLMKHKEFQTCKDIIELKLKSSKQQQTHNNKFYNFLLMIYVTDILPFVLNDDKVKAEINKISDEKIRMVSILD